MYEKVKVHRLKFNKIMSIRIVKSTIIFLFYGTQKHKIQIAHRQKFSIYLAQTKEM